MASQHDSIPLGFFFAYLPKLLPGLQGKPYPPVVQPGLGPVTSLEPAEREAPDKTSPPAM